MGSFVAAVLLFLGVMVGCTAATDTYKTIASLSVTFVTGQDVGRKRVKYVELSVAVECCKRVDCSSSEYECGKMCVIGQSAAFLTDMKSLETVHYLLTYLHGLDGVAKTSGSIGVQHVLAW